MPAQCGQSARACQAGAASAAAVVPAAAGAAAAVPSCACVPACGDIGRRCVRAHVRRVERTHSAAHQLHCAHASASHGHTQCRTPALTRRRMHAGDDHDGPPGDDSPWAPEPAPAPNRRHLLQTVYPLVTTVIGGVHVAASTCAAAPALHPGARAKRALLVQEWLTCDTLRHACTTQTGALQMEPRLSRMGWPTRNQL